MDAIYTYIHVQRSVHYPNNTNEVQRFVAIAIPIKIRPLYAEN
jgi:hypothetical protein